MNPGIGYALDAGSFALVGLLSLAVVIAVVLVVRAQAARRGWTPDAAAALTWSSSLAAVAVLCFVLSRFVLDDVVFYVGVVAPLSERPPSITVTLVWLPHVMALLWSVLHVLRSGTGHHAPLLGVPVAFLVPALWLVAAPLQITVLSVGLLGVLSWVGLAVWLVGQGLVATGRSWVGDVAVWTGVALVAADAWPGYVGLVSPVVVAALVLFQQRRRQAVS